MSPSREQILLALPNLLSLTRLPLGGLFWLALGPTARQSLWAFGVMAAAAVTDVLDGHLARRNAARAAAARGAPPSDNDDEDAAAPGTGGMGAWLDPICDKLFVALVL